MHHSLRATHVSSLNRQNSEYVKGPYRAIHVFALCRHLGQSESELQRWKEDAAGEVVERWCNAAELRECRR